MDKIILDKLNKLERIVVKMVSVMTSKDDLKKFATKDDLKNFATKDDLKKELKQLKTELMEEIAKSQMDLLEITEKNKVDKIDFENLKSKVQKIEKQIYTA